MLAMGVASVSRLASVNGLAVRLAPDRGGTTVEVTGAGQYVVVRRAHAAQQPVIGHEPLTEFIPHEMQRRVLVPADSARDELEAFLEGVFGVLRGTRGTSPFARSRPYSRCGFPVRVSR